jgi:hypothetical protein
MPDGNSKAMIGNVAITVFGDGTTSITGGSAGQLSADELGTFGRFATALESALRAATEESRGA